MKRKFVSALSLLSEVIPKSSKKIDWYLHMPSTIYGMEDIFNPGPVFNVCRTGVRVNETKEEYDEHPLDVFRREIERMDEAARIPEEALGEETPEEEVTGLVREIVVEKPLYNGRIPENTRIRIPYILELEYLIDSEFQLEETEIKILDRLFIQQLFTWFYVTKQDTEYEIFDMLPRLEQAGVIYDIDVDENGRISDTSTLVGLIKHIYRDCFVPLDIASDANQANQMAMFMAAPVSSLDAMDTINRYRNLRSDEKHRKRTDAKGLLYMPFIMTFYLLEKDTSELQAYDLKAFDNYLRKIPIWWITPTEENEGSQEDGSNFDSRSISYGYISSDCYTRVTENTDLLFIKKMITKVLNDLEEIVKSNRTVISVNSPEVLNHMRKGKVAFLLNFNTLNWEMEDES